MATENRLIDADRLVEWLIKAGRYLKGTENSKPITKAIGKIIDHVKGMPTVDAVEVVRCRNCRHRHTRHTCAGRPQDFFCADGER